MLTIPTRADDHFFDVITSRLCNFQPLPCNAQGDCVTAADAAKVFDIGAPSAAPLSCQRTDFMQAISSTSTQAFAGVYDSPLTRLQLHLELR